ncbi:MAG: UbiA family prenyltransferase [Candidatus Aenigmatarchaeota archaeon]
MKHFIRLIRPLNCGMAALAVLIGAYLGGITGSFFFVLIAMVSAFLICGGGMVINDYYDRELDFIFNSERPLPSGKISLKGALVYAFVLFAIGLYLSFWIGNYALLLAIFNSMLLVIYAKTLQKKFFLSNTTVAFLVGSTFVYGGLAVGDWLTPLLLGILAFFATMAREIIKDIEDRYADSRAGIQSVPITLGEEKSRLVAAVFILIAVLTSPLPYLLNVFSWIYLIAVVPSVLTFLYAGYLSYEDEEPAVIQNLLKIAMVLGLIAFLVGVF